MRQQVSVVTLGVRDMARAVAFYEAMGWKQIDDGGGDTAPRIFKAGSELLLALYDWTLLAADATLPPESYGFRGITLAQCLASPADVDSVMASAAAAGANILKPAAPTFWGGYGGYFADPDDHVWEIAHNPWWFDADGNVIADQPGSTS